MTEKTPEELASETARKEEQKAKAKADRAAAAAVKKEQREATKLTVKAAKDAAKVAKVQAKVQAKADASAAKQSTRQPEQNGVRRPKPATLCGRAWAVFDSLSTSTGAPAAISEALKLSREAGLNDANVRAEYARWRKFHGVTGRVVAPVTQAAAAE